MQTETLLLGFLALTIWGWLWYQSSRSSPIGWASPTSLFATGLLVFNVIPSLYWLFRPWTYYFPAYLDGLPLVLGSIAVFGLPFLHSAMLKGLKAKPRPAVKRDKPLLQNIEFGRLWWLLLIPLAIGVGWRLNMLTMGWQGRLARENPTLFGSESLALIIHNFAYYYCVIYFLLIAFGKKYQRRIGKLVWIMDGLLQLILMSRHKIIRFVLVSLIFSRMFGYRPKFRLLAVLGVFGIFVFSVIGMSHSLMTNYLDYGSKYLSPVEVINLLEDGTVKYLTGNFGGNNISTESNRMFRGLDDAMYRLYDARSASAVMKSVPERLPYAYGKTFMHLLYIFIPRYFWPEKPNMLAIHSITKIVMAPEKGNPVGTIAELYLNLGLFAILFGGIVSLLFCNWSETIFTNKQGIRASWVGMYPVLAEQFIHASHNFTQRISEGFRALLVWILIVLLLQLVKKNTQKETSGVHTEMLTESL